MDKNYLIISNNVEIIEDEEFIKSDSIIFVPKSVKRIGREAFGKNTIVCFEGYVKDIQTYYDSYEEPADYPDSYYRGPSMGGSTTVITRFYVPGAKIKENMSYEEFL